MIDVSEFLLEKSNPRVEQFDALLKLLYEKCNEENLSLDELVSSDMNSFQVPSKMAPLFNDFMEQATDIVPEIDLKLFREKNSDLPGESLFWMRLLDIWEIIEERKSYLHFFSGMQKEQIENLISVVFEKYINHKDQPSSIGAYSFEQVNEVINLLTVAEKNVVSFSHSKDTFQSIMRKYYTLSDENLEFIWDLLKKHHNDLFQKEILERLETLQSEHDKMYNMIKTLIDTLERLTNSVIEEKN